MFELNRSGLRGQPLLDKDRMAFGPDAVEEVVRMMELHPSYRATPTHSMERLACQLGVDRVWVKDESGRFGLGSFKALGGAFAVVRVAQKDFERRFGRALQPRELLDPNVRACLRHITVGCATDGNHGKSVAAGAALLGMRARIFVHEGVSGERVDAIAHYGADIVVVKGNYDDAVEFAGRECEANGWIIVSDTSWEGYEDIPRMVMQGYTTMVHELAAQIDGMPTHVFLQAGVGGFAAAISAGLALRGPCTPKFVIVEPSRAACLFESNRAGRCVEVAPQEPTVMSMLECYKPSEIAWGVLARLATAYITIEEEDAVAAMRTLATHGAGFGLISGESGAAGAAGMLASCDVPGIRSELGIDSSSKILLISTEGATAPSIYRRLMSDGSRSAQPTPAPALSDREPTEPAAAP